MKKLITLVFSLAIFGIANATDVSGNIAVNTTWDLAGSPYVVTGNVTVNAGITLTIDAGVEVKFNSGRSMFAYGDINATSATLTSNVVGPAHGDWNLLEFYSGSVSTFSNCIIEYGDYIDVNSGATLTVNNTSTIQNMYYYGIYSNGNLNVTNSTIDLAGYVLYGYGIYAYSSSVTNLNNVNIFNCNYGVYIYSDASQVNFTDCSVSSNVWPVYFRYAGDITIAGTNDFTGNTRDAFYIYMSSISKNWTLPYVNVPYFFRTNFTVNNTYTLTIAANNIIKFAMNTGMEVRGKLTANAGAGDNIFFTSERDDNWGGDTNGDGTSTAPAVSNWKGIQFYDECDDASVMRRCQLRYAGYYHIGGITLYDASPTIDLCELQFNYYGAYFLNASNPTFTNNTVGSSSITPIAMSFEANPVFTNNVLSFMDNQYDAIGLIGGTLTANAHLIQRDFTTVSNITYYMLSEIIVPSGLTLTIDPGIVIKSSTYTYRFRIQGKLIADGTAADWITFTSVKDDNHGNPGDTNKDGTSTNPSTGDISAIIFEDGYDPTSIMDYVRIKYASVYSYAYSNGGSNHYLHGCAIATLSAVAPAPAGPTISNCEIRESAYGVSSYQASNPVVTNNSFINITNTPLSLAGSASPTYSGNTFTNCGIVALGLIGHNVVVNGTISKRNVSGYTNITYVLLEDITVMTGTYLDIDPGVVVKMLSRYWYIDGGFKLNGTVSEHVVFTSLYDDNVGNPMDTNGDGNATTPSAGNWHRIEFDETSDDAYCEFNYADIQYGGYSSYGVIRTINASPEIYNTLIDQGSGFGIRCDGNSAPIFDAVDIQNCTSDPIAMSLTSNPTFTNITFAANYSNGIFILEGTLSTNATLNKRNVAGFTNIPYIIDALTISAGTELTLESGIIIKFRGSYFDGIYVHGALSAIGTAGQKIIFTSFKDDSAGGDTNNDGSSSVPGTTDWDGILYYPEGDDAINKLIYCELRYGGGGYSNPFGTGSHHGVVRIKDAYVQINQTIFQQGYYSAIGIYGSANPAITSCQIDNFNNFPVFMAMFSNPTFSGNSISNIAYNAIGIQNETWSQTAIIPQRNFAGYTNITYYMHGATINSGTTITIPAGTVFKSANTDLYINGKIEVDGASGNPVVFTDYRDDDYGNPADTEQNGSGSTPSTYGPEFYFNDVCDDASYIDYALLRYAQYPVRLTSASPSITNNIFHSCYYGVYHSGVCTPVIDNNTFDDLLYAPMVISLVAYPASTSGNVISGTTYKGIQVKNETLTQDETLPKRSFGGISNIPYLFSSYTIGTGVTLTIDPGVICKFYQNGTITNNYALYAVGVAASGENIVFTSLTDDFYGGDTNSDGDATGYGSTNWDYMYMTDQSHDTYTRFESCIFRHSWNSYGALRFNNSWPAILNCSFNNCYQGVYATGSAHPTINYCDFYEINQNAVNNVDHSFTIDAENCWWGDNTGPTHTGNPGGTGEPVTDYVDYDPYGTSGANNPIMGDVSLNSLIQAYDASLILLYIVDPVTYPLNPTQLNVAEVSGTPPVSALDASLILQFVVGLINNFPVELLAPAPYFVSDVELIISDINVEPGEEFDLPLSISNVSGVYAMQTSISYNPQYITALNVENLITDMNCTFHIDEEAELINIAFAGIESLENNMTIANLKFIATAEIGLAIETPVEAEYFMANETDLTWNVHNGTVMINGLATGYEEFNEEKAKLLSCYPNPFNDQLTIEYTIQQEGNVQIAVYDMYGKMVAEIANGRHAAETYQLNWNGEDLNGIRLNLGTYFVRIFTGSKVETEKIQLVR